MMGRPRQSSAAVDRKEVWVKDRPIEKSSPKRWHFGEEAKGYIRAFCQTPIGRVISIGAREVIQAKKDGRELDETDLAELCLRIPAILKGADLGPGGKK